MQPGKENGVTMYQLLVGIDQWMCLQHVLNGLGFNPDRHKGVFLSKRAVSTIQWLWWFCWDKAAGA